MNVPLPFQSSEFATFCFDDHEVRAVTIDGEPWFVAHDVEKSIALGNYANTYAKLDPSEKQQVEVHSPSGNSYLLNLVNESGLYLLVLRCHDAVRSGTPAHRFRRWITSEVVPTLRKTGTYSVAPAPAETTPAQPPVNPPPSTNPALEDALRKLQGLQALEEERYALIRLCEQLLQERLDATQAQIEALLAEQEKQRKLCMENISTMLAQIKEIEQLRKVHLAKEFGIESTGKLVKSEKTSLSPELNSLVKIGALS